MPRKPRPLDRDAGRVRDASLIVIASEDRYAVAQYFARFHSSRVQVRVVPTENGQSAPSRVLARLKAWMSEYDLDDQDSFWLCLDTDHWTQSEHLGTLTEVLQESRKSNINVALTNPCFEFWLLLHFSDSPLADAGIDPSSSDPIPCGRFERALRQVVGSYQKSSVDQLPLTAALVRDAMQRAESRWNTPVGSIPDRPSTGVHHILDAIAARKAFSFV